MAAQEDNWLVAKMKNFWIRPGGKRQPESAGSKVRYAPGDIGRALDGGGSVNPSQSGKAPTRTDWPGATPKKK